jgi:flagellar hook assembly protein FlgD
MVKLKITSEFKIIVFLCFFMGVGLFVELNARFKNTEEYFTGGRSAGVADAWVAGPFSAEGVFHNPASIESGEDLSFLLYAGNGPRNHSGHFSAALVYPLEFDMAMGFSLQSSQAPQDFDYNYQMAGVTMKIDLLQKTSVGVRGRYHNLYNSILNDNIQGFSFDLGAVSVLDILGSWNHKLALAFNLDDVAGVWPDENWQSAVSAVLKSGLGYFYKNFVYLGVEYVNPLDPLWQGGLRVGAEYTPWDNFALRVGTFLIDPNAYSFGASYRAFKNWPLLHYAGTWHPLTSAFMHRIQLDFSFQVKTRPLYAIPLQVIYEPGTKSVKMARISLNVENTQKVDTWELEIRDGSGRVIRTLRGEGNPPTFVTWDGKDALGEIAKMGENISYRLNIKTPEGNLSSKPVMNIADSMSGMAFSALLVEEARTRSQVDLVPVFETDNSQELSHMLIKVPDEKNRNLKNWQVVITDSKGGVLQKISGQGALPANLTWDGKDAQGMKIKDTLGLQISFVMENQGGEIENIRQPVFSQLSYEQAVLAVSQKPVLQIAEGPLKGKKVELNFADSWNWLTFLNEGSKTQISAIKRYFDKPESVTLTSASKSAGFSTKSKEILSESVTGIILDIFKPDSSAFNEKAILVLRDLRNELKKYNGYALRITGYGSRQERAVLHLARQRAMALSEALLASGDYTGRIYIRVQREPYPISGAKVEYVKNN